MDFLILAAGKGERLHGAGNGIVKPLVEIDGRPMIARLASLMLSSGEGRLVIVYNPDLDGLEREIKDMEERWQGRVRGVAFRSPCSLATLCRGLSEMPESSRTVVSTVDAVSKTADFAAYLDECKANGADAVMGLTRYVDDEKALYVAVGEDMRVTGFRDMADDSTSYVSAGIYCLGRKAMDIALDCGERGMTRLRDFQKRLLTDGLDVRGYDMGMVVDVDRIEDIAAARVLLHGNFSVE